MKIDKPYLADIKYIAFDFCGTLAELLPDTGELLKKFVKDTYGHEFSMPVIQEAIKKVSADLPYSSVKINNKELRSAYYQNFNCRLLESLGCVPVKPENLYSYFNEFERHWALKRGGRELLEQLKALGYELVLASNFDKNLEHILMELKIYNNFSMLFVSGAIGIEKPSIHFFENIIATLGCLPEHVLMVGDDLNLDIFPSYKAGMKSVHIDHNGAEALPSLVRFDDFQYIHVNNFSSVIDALLQFSKRTY